MRRSGISCLLVAVLRAFLIHVSLLCLSVSLQNVLYTLGQLAAEFPEVQESLQVRLQEADLRLPSKPPAKMGGTAGAAQAGGGNMRVSVVNRNTME